MILGEFITPVDGPDLLRKNKACSEVLLKQVQRRLRQGGDSEDTFLPLRFPRLNGMPGSPLNAGGFHLLASITAGYDASGFWIETDFEAATILQFGGTIVPTAGRSLKIPTIDGFIHAKKAVIPSRPYFRVTAEDIKELVHTFEEA